VFHDEKTNYFKGTNVIKHELLLDDIRLIMKPQYRVPYSKGRNANKSKENAGYKRYP